MPRIEVAKLLHGIGTAARPASALETLTEPLNAIADQEEALWSALAQWSGRPV